MIQSFLLSQNLIISYLLRKGSFEFFRQRIYHLSDGHFLCVNVVNLSYSTESSHNLSEDILNVN